MTRDEKTRRYIAQDADTRNRTQADAAKEAGDEAGMAQNAHRKAAVHYLVAAAACGAFALVYAQFSHGVSSPFMTFMFSIPLVGGAIVALALHLARVRPLPRTARQAWALALASLTVASCLRGIFDIAGTASPYLVAYLAAAGVFAFVALAAMRRV